MRSNQNKLTKEVIRKVYDMRMAGESHNSISRALSLSSSTVWGTLVRLDKYMKGPINKKSGKLINTAYLEVIADIRAEVPSTPLPKKEKEDEQAKTSDPYDRLNSAFTKFTEELGNFVDEFMTLKAKHTIDEIKRLKAENEELKKTVNTILDEAKTANWISTLKKRFG